jgi:nucleoside-diphosphate-sugar epimerase
VSTTLVTGGCGYFGSLLARHLLEHGHDVRVFDLVDDIDLDVDVRVGDIRDTAAVAAAVRGVDVIFHNVAQVPLVRDRTLLETVNVNGTRVLLDAAAAAGVSRVVHTSSSAVFGIPRANPVSTTAPLSPVEPYGTTKARAEQICAEYTGRLDVSIVRPRTILGHGRLGIFGILFDWVADGADPFVLGRGDNRYQFVHADDLADLCRRVGELPGSHVFNAGTDRFGTMYETLDALCRHAGTGSQVRRIPAAPAVAIMRTGAALRIAPFAPYHWLMYGRSMWFDIDDAVEVTGWRPRWSNDDMLRQSYDWFVANRYRPAGISWHSRSARQGAVSFLKQSTQLLARRT